MFFKTATFYKLTEAPKIGQFSPEKFAGNSFKPCAASSIDSIGFVNPLTGEAESETDLQLLPYELNGNILLALRHDQKIIPAAVVKREVADTAKSLEKEFGHPVSKKELKDIKEGALVRLTAKAFVKTTIIYGFINKQHSIVVVDAGSESKAELFLSSVRKALGSLQVQPVDFNKDIGTEMTDWMANDFPVGLTPGDSASLNLPHDGAASFKNVDLDDTNIHAHIENGGRVKKLELVYQDKLSFALQDDGIVKKIKFLDSAMDDRDVGSDEDESALFAADFILNTALLVELYLLFLKLFG